MEPNPLQQLINLRAQAEKASKTQQLYDQRIGGWLSWGIYELAGPAVRPLRPKALSDRHALFLALTRSFAAACARNRGRAEGARQML